MNLNAEMDTTYSTENAKNQIETLKKMYKKASTFGSPSTWSFFDILDVMWSKTPKCTGLMGGLDTYQLAKGNKEILNDLEQEVGTTAEVSASTSQDSCFVNRTMGEGMSKLCDTLRDVEERHNATLRELQESRHALEERLERIREEEDRKRQQIYLSTQMELAKSKIRI
ncbi:hypothetical protein L7F22_015326 [Adiantum nelumboides]|nr:hypothetical protein [Adiantum nelumboides]